MIEPARRTEKYIESRIRFHEAGAYLYSKRNQTRLEKWSREQADVWKARLAALRKVSV